MKRFLHLIRYIKLLKNNKKVLADSRINDNPNPKGIQYDWIYRLYTVLNLPFDDKENIEKYGYYYVDNMVKEHISQMNEFLFNLGILEYVTLDKDEIEQLDENNIRIVLKFKYLDIKFWFKILIILVPIIFIIGIISLIFLL